MSSSIWITGVICLVVGAIIGVVIGRLMTSRKPQANAGGNASQRDNEERALKHEVDEHLSRLTDIAEALQKQSIALSAELAEKSDTFTSDPLTKRRLALLAGTRTQEDIEEEEAAGMTAPRDYAEGKGTLAEGFGLNKDQPADRPKY